MNEGKKISSACTTNEKKNSVILDILSAAEIPYLDFEKPANTEETTNRVEERKPDEKNDQVDGEEENTTDKDRLEDERKAENEDNAKAVDMKAKEDSPDNGETQLVEKEEDEQEVPVGVSDEDLEEVYDILRMKYIPISYQITERLINNYKRFSSIHWNYSEKVKNTEVESTDLFKSESINNFCKNHKAEYLYNGFFEDQKNILRRKDKKPERFVIRRIYYEFKKGEYCTNQLFEELGIKFLERIDIPLYSVFCFMLYNFPVIAEIKEWMPDYSFDLYQFCYNELIDSNYRGIDESSNNNKKKAEEIDSEMVTDINEANYKNNADLNGTQLTEEKDAANEKLKYEEYLIKKMKELEENNNDPLKVIPELLKDETLSPLGKIQELLNQYNEKLFEEFKSYKDFEKSILNKVAGNEGEDQENEGEDQEKEMYSMPYAFADTLKVFLQCYIGTYKNSRDIYSEHFEELHGYDINKIPWNKLGIVKKKKIEFVFAPRKYKQVCEAFAGTIEQNPYLSIYKSFNHTESQVIT
ncbi:MAG: hypothetical protein LUH14_08650 [Clostridiaceae bacterium]|nr:hypothetical protein [Clostridiaceae bacterium]